MVTSRASNAMRMKREKNAAAIIEPKDEPVPCDEVHVLAVDDCLIDRKVIEKLLTSHSFKVTTVESAAKALEFLGLNEEQSACPCSNSLKVNMIITDYCMPEMTGYDLLKKVKETKGLKEIPVVIMSSENVPQRVTSCLAEGAEDFIIKPVKLSDIMKLKGHINRAKSEESGSASGAVNTKRKVWPGRVRSKLSERRPRVNALLFP